MNTRNDIQNETDHQNAAEWFVALHAETVDQATNDAFLAWLNSAPENQADYERCEAAAIMAEKLKSDPDLAWAFEESAQLAAGSAPQLQRRSLTRWFNKRKLEFGMAGLTIVGVAVVLVQYEGDEITETPTLSTGQMADSLAPEDALADPIVVLPGAVVVPSNSVAVLPFQDLGSDPASADTTENLHVEILSQLAAMPSLYVPVLASVMPYAAGGYSITEIASQLGVRGIVEGTVRQSGDRVRVTVQLIDASTGGHLFAESYDRLVTDLSAVYADVVINIAAALNAGARFTRAVLPNSIAVLPFESVSPDPDDVYFAAGIHEEILNQLVKLRALNVIARTSVLRYADGQTPIAQIAEELNVETIMEGSVRHANGRVLVTAHLIDPETNAHLWSEAYEREFSDVYAIQAEIAMNIARALEAELVGQQALASAEVRRRTLVWVDRDGREEPIAVPQALYSSVSLSPDGQRVAVSMAQQGNRDIWILDLRLGTFSRLTFDPIDETAPVFSPDGEWVGYWDGNGQLRRIAASGGAPLGIADVASNLYGMSWEADDTILFGQPEGIYRVPATGGIPELVIPAEGGTRLYGPEFLPDGDSVLFSVGRVGDWDASRIVVQSLSTGERIVLVDGGSDARYLPTGHIIFAIGDGLFTVAFDPATMTVSGGAVPLVQGVTRAAANERSSSLSPDGRWIAYQSDESGRSEIYVRPFPEVDSGRWQISTSGGSGPFWSRDGRELFYYLGGPGQTYAVMAVSVESEPSFRVGAPEMSFQGDYPVPHVSGAFYDVSPDGQRLLIIKGAENETEGEQSQVITVENWFEELNRLAPVAE